MCVGLTALLPALSWCGDSGIVVDDGGSGAVITSQAGIGVGSLET
jgi:hypothetical protein